MDALPHAVARRIALITDEYSADPATAFELGRRWGIERFEIRTAYRFRVPVAPAWAAERLAAAAKDYAVTITGISPGLFKPTMNVDGSNVPIAADTPGEIRRHLDELLPRFLEFADRLGTRNMIVFALRRAAGETGNDPPAAVIDALAGAAELAGKAGFTLLLENGGGSWADSAAATAAILRAVDSPALKLTWDPANVAHAQTGEDPVAEGYPLVRPWVVNVHVKDVGIIGGQPAWRMLGDGAVAWPAQLAALAADGYAGPLTIEPHLQYQPGAHLNLVAMMEEFLARFGKMLTTADGAAH